MTAEERAALDRLTTADSKHRYSAIIAIGKAFLTNLAPAIEPYLRDPDPELRSAAIRTLGFYWCLPAYRAVAEVMMRDEPDEHARAVAVMAWTSYEHATRNLDALRRLHAIANDEAEAETVRDQAFRSFFTVFLPDGVGHPKSSYRWFDKRANRERLEAALKELGDL
ncbi:MAG TPA: HEAT repeat domain-containing protein [Kofleriaceae bacterium]|jgi:HEAT repeat protein